MSTTGIDLDHPCGPTTTRPRTSTMTTTHSITSGNKSPNRNDKVVLNTYCLERIVRFCLEPLFVEPCRDDGRQPVDKDSAGNAAPDGQEVLIAPARRVAQPRLAALMRVNKQMNLWASRLLYRHISLDIESLVSSLFGDITPALLQPPDGNDVQECDMAQAGSVALSADDAASRRAPDQSGPTAQDPSLPQRQRQQMRLAQLACIETMHLDMQVYIDEDSDPNDFRPMALQQITAYYNNQLALRGMHLFRDNQHVVAKRHIPLPRLRAIHLFRNAVVWRLDWPAGVLYVLARLSNVGEVCHSAFDQVPVTDDELGALCRLPHEIGPNVDAGSAEGAGAGAGAAAPNRHSAPADTSSNIAVNGTYGSTVLRHHRGALRAIGNAFAPGAIKIELDPALIAIPRSGCLDRTGVLYTLQDLVMSYLRVIDHSQRIVRGESDVPQRSICIYGLDRILIALRPDAEEWKRAILRDVESGIRDAMQRGWYAQWIRHDRFQLKMADVIPDCEACGRPAWRGERRSSSAVDGAAS